MRKLKSIANKVVSRKKILNEFTIIIIAQICTTIIALFSVRILTEYLSPSEYGVLGLSLSVITIINQLIFGPFSNSFSRFYSIYKQNNRINEYSNIILEIIKRIFISAVIILSIVMVIISLLDISLLMITVLSISFALLTGLNCIFDGIQNAARDRIIVAFHQIGFVLFKIIFAVILIKLIESSACSVLIGYILGGIIIIGSQFIFLKKRLIFTSKNYSISSLKEIKDYTYPFIYWGFFTFLYQISDKWLLQFFQNTKTVGFYTVLYQLGYSPLIIITRAIVKVLSPILFEKAGDASNTKRMEIVKKYNTIIMLTSLAITFIAFIVVFYSHEIIFKIFVSKSFYEISYLLPYMVLAAGFFATGEMVTIYQLSKVSSKHLSFPKILTAIIGLVLNIIGAYLCGVRGIIYSLALYSLIYLVWMILITYRGKYYAFNR